MQHRADFFGGGEESLGGGAAGDVLRELAIAEREPAAGRRAGGADARDEVGIGVRGSPVVADAVVGRELRLQVEAVQRHPFAVGEHLHAPVSVVVVDQAEGFVGRGLFDVGNELQRSSGRVATEADVGQPRFSFGFDAQQHVGARSDRVFGLSPQHASGEVGDLEADRAQDVAEQAVLFEAVAAAMVAHQFALDGCDVEGGGDAEERVEVFERDGGDVRGDDGAQGLQGGGDGLVDADPFEVCVEVDGFDW